MRILIIPSWYLTKNNKIMGSFFREQALMLKKQGHEVAIIKVDLHGISEKIEQELEVYNDNGVITVIKHIKSYGIAKNAWVYCEIIKKYYLKLFKYICDKEFVPDIIQAHSFLPAGFAACYIGRKNKIPVVVTEHSSNVHTKKLNRTSLSVLKYVVRKCNAFVCVSNSLKKTIEELTGQTNIKVIPNNLSPDFYFTKKKIPTPFSFVCVGNLIDSKRQGLLIDCFEKAFVNGDEELYLAGQGKNHDLLQSQISKLKLKERVHLLGPLSRIDVAALLNEKKVFCLLSYSETFGVAYIEALACGCPVIATRNGGAEEIINEGNGILVNIDNEEETIKALRRMRLQYDEYDIDRISKECIKLYGEPTIYQLTTQLYGKILSEYKRRYQK